MKPPIADRWNYESAFRERLVKKLSLSEKLGAFHELKDDDKTAIIEAYYGKDAGVDVKAMDEISKTVREVKK